MENQWFASLEVPKVAVANACVSPRVVMLIRVQMVVIYFTPDGLISVVFFRLNVFLNLGLRYELLLCLFS
jgi:hypothetical protein